MIIRLTKAKKQSKQDTLACLRDDGSRTWWPLASHFAEHDLLHYAVETTLGLEEAFFGLIAAGRDIQDFGTRDGQKDFYPQEAIRAEFIVALLQSQLRADTFSDNNKLLTLFELTAEKTPNLPPLNVTTSHLNSIRATMADLKQRWESLLLGYFMELEFP